MHSPDTVLLPRRLRQPHVRRVNAPPGSRLARLGAPTLTINSERGTEGHGQ
jgi:hypothetical protein